ncbi:MAG: hypothetical protein KatS3mg087_1406 [Patescibacteria group bacterium]|nr:MAG: hypothetical protein KatS3mg087_1406 [Patescibacteria group bacterium]
MNKLLPNKTTTPFKETKMERELKLMIKEVSKKLKNVSTIDKCGAFLYLLISDLQDNEHILSPEKLERLTDFAKDLVYFNQEKGESDFCETMRDFHMLLMPYSMEDREKLVTCFVHYFISLIMIKPLETYYNIDLVDERIESALIVTKKIREAGHEINELLKEKLEDFGLPQR